MDGLLSLTFPQQIHPSFVTFPPFPLEVSRRSDGVPPARSDLADYGYIFCPHDFNPSDIFVGIGMGKFSFIIQTPYIILGGAERDWKEMANGSGHRPGRT